MKCYNILVGALLAAASLTGNHAFGRVSNSPAAPGYIDRGRTMLADLNCLGANQQTQQALRLDASQSQTEEAEYIQALAALHDGNKQAPRLLAEWIDRYPESPRRLNAVMAIGDYYFGNGRYGEALNYYTEVPYGALDQATDDDLIYRTAYCHLLLADYAKAESLFNRLATGGRDPYANAARFYLGYMAYRDGEYEKALSLLQAPGRSGDPELAPAAWAYMSQIYYTLGDNEKALAEGRKVLASNATAFHPEANRVCGEALYALGRTQEAIPLLWLYADAVEEPDPTALYILGTDEYGKGEYKNCISLLRRVVSADIQTDATHRQDLGAMQQSAWLYLGQAYAATGKTDNALMAFDSARRGEYDPQVAETAFYNYAVATVDGGRAPFGSSVRTLEEFLSKYPRSTYAPVSYTHLTLPTSDLV